MTYGCRLCPLQTPRRGCKRGSPPLPPQERSSGLHTSLFARRRSKRCSAGVRGVGALSFPRWSRPKATFRHTARLDFRRESRSLCRCESGNQPTRLGNREHWNASAGRRMRRPEACFHASPDSYCADSERSPFTRLALSPGEDTTGADELHFLHYRGQPHGGHRARAHHWSTRPGKAHHCVLRRLLRAGKRELMETKFRESINKALHNPNLTGALGRFSEAYRISRQKGYDFEALRTQIAERKSYAASHLDELADLFTKNAEARGTKVFRTNDPAKVREYILNLARKNGVKSVVKSKSMASEEIHLNKHLEAAGIEVGETDLGERIIQLAGQTPSHMVMPAIHMTKEEVATVFNEQVEAGQKPDIPKLVKFARAKLRTKFLNAEMGITGANIAVAETGTLVIVTNEGNARLVTTLPKIHVAIVGLEKLMEKFEDVVPVLTALPKSATAQLMTSYVSMISGPVPNTDGSLKQLHVILMDNRRTEMSQDPKFKQAMQFIRCASCLNVCPVFRLVGGHVFGKIYTGGIGTILTAWFDALKASDDIQGLC